MNFVVYTTGGDFAPRFYTTARWCRLPTLHHWRGFCAWCEPLTVGDARRLWSEYLAAGGEGTGKEFGSFVNEILVQYPNETLLLDILNFPELHVMLGLVQKLLDYIKLASSTHFAQSVIDELNITETYHRGKKGLNGNACKKLIENATLFIIKSKALPNSCDKAKIVAAAKTMSLFNNMVNSYFGQLVEEGWEQDVKDFCAAYRALVGISYPPKFHLVEGRLVQFLKRRWSLDNSYKGFGSEQPVEALHHKFEEHFDSYKVGRMHEDYGNRLLDAVLSWNSRRISLRLDN